MMPSTIVGLFIVVVAVLPGVVYTLSFERQASGFGVTLADRTLRFIAVSVVFHLVFAWPEYGLFRATLADHDPSDPILTGQFTLLWFAAAAIVVLPAIAGTIIGGPYRTRTTRSGWCWIRRGLRLSEERERKLLKIVLGPDPAPRAWDHLFSERPDIYVRVRTTDGKLMAGTFAKRSYAAGFPNDPDLLLEEAWSLKPDGALDKRLGYPLYIAAGQIAWLEIVRQE
jgi:hypothetical protein